MRFSREHVAHGFRQLKGFTHHAVGQGYKMAQSFDQGIHTLKKIYGVLAPIIDQVTGGAQNAGIMKALTNYEDLCERAIGLDRQVQETGGKLRVAAPEIFG